MDSIIMRFATGRERMALEDFERHLLNPTPRLVEHTVELKFKLLHIMQRAAAHRRADVVAAIGETELRINARVDATMQAIKEAIAKAHQQELPDGEPYEFDVHLSGDAAKPLFA